MYSQGVWLKPVLVALFISMKKFHGGLWGGGLWRNGMRGVALFSYNITSYCANNGEPLSGGENIVIMYFTEQGGQWWALYHGCVT